MKLFLKIILIISIFLAVTSGITKIILMPQDVEFFGKYGFTNLMLIVFGATQLIGGILLAIEKTRFAGAALIAITFLISAALLILDNNIPVAIITLVVTGLLGMLMKQSFKK